ncbi:hypothetical protein F5Y19DRAFT_443121 [Xylariaceae sp. FL1651]|nr:hypothetical protein F5Y19DRAFT_443121 [Xylariaceae sp. FL1651]
MGISECGAAESASTLPEVDALSDTEAAKLMRKIGFRVLPILFLIYLTAFRDRSVILILFVFVR